MGIRRRTLVGRLRARITACSGLFCVAVELGLGYIHCLYVFFSLGNGFKVKDRCFSGCNNTIQGLRLLMRLLRSRQDEVTRLSKGPSHERDATKQQRRTDSIRVYDNKTMIELHQCTRSPN